MTGNTGTEGRRPVEIRNRDIPLLAGVTLVMQEVKRTENRRKWQRERMDSIRAQQAERTRGNAPRGLDEAFAALSELDEEHREMCKSYVLQIRKARRIIEGIESRSMRAFVEMKYVDEEPDIKVMKALRMSRRGFERAKKCVEDAPCMAAVKWQERYILAAEDRPEAAQNRNT